MKPLSVDDVRALLPESDLLQPLLDRIIAVAKANPEQRWTATGELETLGDRIVPVESLAEELPRLTESVRTHAEALFGAVVDALSALASGEVERAADALLLAANVEGSYARLTEAEAFVGRALALAERFRDQRRLVPILLAGARIARARGRWKEAEDRYGRAAEIATALMDAPSAARALVGWGNIAVDRGGWTTALERYRSAEGWVEKAERPLAEAWHIPLNRSIVAREEGDLERAEGELIEARSRADRLGDPDAAAILDNQEGQVLRAMHRRAEAEAAFRRALDEARTPDAKVTIAANLAELLLEDRSRALEAGEWIRRGEEIAVRQAVTPRLPELYVLLGRIAELRGHADAFVFFERGLEIVTNSGLPDIERARVLERYGAFELRRGEEESAAAHLEEATEIYRRLGHRQALARIAGNSNQPGEVRRELGKEGP